MRPLIQKLSLLGIVGAVSLLLATPGESAAMQQSNNVFWSGHSLTDPPIPQMLAEISKGFGVPMRWNRHSMAGASMEARTRGRPANLNGWDGYQQGNNRDSYGMDVINEFRTAASVGGEGYDTLIITEVHDFLWSVLRGDTVRLLRHYHERFLDGNPEGQTFFYQAWLNVYDKSRPQPWIDYERAAEPIWQCIATRVNVSLEAEGRSDRLRFLPAGMALTALVESATTGNGVPGITAATTPLTMNRIFRDTVHLTDSGSYYVALLSYAFTQGKSPKGAWAPEGMENTTAATLQDLAWDFYTNYNNSDTALTLTECSARIRDTFAEQFWQFIDARARHSEQAWYKSIWQRIKGPASMKRNIREARLGFAEDNPDNPFRYKPDEDANYWYPPP